MLSRTLLATMGLTLLSCSPAETARAPAAGRKPGPTSEPEPATDSAPPRADAGGAPRARKPFTILNGCTDVVTVAFGDDPAQETASRRRIATGSSADAPRDAEGNQTVWLLDSDGSPLVKVRVTRGMKVVEVGRSCRTLDAR